VRHFGTKLGTPKPAVFPLDAATSVRKSTLFDPMMRISFASTSMRQRAQVIAAVAALFGPHAPAGPAGEGFQRLGYNSSNRSPNQASKTSISVSVTGTSFGQSSVTAQVTEARFARRTRGRTRIVVEIVKWGAVRRTP